MRFFSNALFIGILGLAGVLTAQQTVVLQQGVDGYTGCSWTKMLSNSTNGEGNKKYIFYFSKNRFVVSLYEC